MGIKRLPGVLTRSSRISATFIVFELFFNPLSCRKMVIIQMIPVLRKANELCGDAVDCSPAALDAFCLYL